MEKVRILLTGSYGQLGSEIVTLAPGYPNLDFKATDADTLDITNPEQVHNFFQEYRPDYVVNCAAYTAVDQAEDEPEKAMLLNGKAPGILAEDLVPLISPAAPSSDKEPLHIRRAMLEDAETLWNIHRTAIREKASSHYRDSVIRRWLESIPRQDYERLLYERDLFVAEQNDQIVGFGQLNAQAEEIEAMYIDPDVSAPPVAAKLLAHLERVAQRNQISSLKLSAPLYAVETYQRAGYLQEALATYQFSNGPELAYATMRKQLN